MDDDELSNLPIEAFTSDGHAIEIENRWLRRADKEDQSIAIRSWFLSRYCDPAFETPYNGREGGYMFIHGGPYHPSEEIRARFERLADDEVIAEVIDELLSEVGDQWAPILYHDDERYDEDFGVEVSAADEPRLRLNQRLRDINELMSLKGGAEAVSLAHRMAFSAAIAALESYLWETMVYWVEVDNTTVRNIVEKIPAFRDQQVKLGDIFSKYANLKQDIKAHLQNMVWHRWKNVVPLFEFGLGIEPPNVGQFEDAVLKRHDIVHRSGHTKAGLPISVTKAEISILSEQLAIFAVNLNTAIERRAGGTDIPTSL